MVCPVHEDNVAELISMTRNCHHSFSSTTFFSEENGIITDKNLMHRGEKRKFIVLSMDKN